MRTQRTLSGCCLLLRFYDRLSGSDRNQIVDESRAEVNDDDYVTELKALMRIKIQIQSKGALSLTSKQKKLWDEESIHFGNKQ